MEDSLKLRVKRFGIYQQITFRLKTIDFGSSKSYYYGTEEVVEYSELLRLANEKKLPFGGRNGIVYPLNKSAKDYLLDKS